MADRLRWIGLAAAAALGVAGWIWGPLLLRRVELFEIRRVEVTGATLLSAAEVLEASGVGTGQNLWDDRDLWTASLLEHGAVESVRITRRIPGTLRIAVREKEPVAYVEVGALRLATEAGELLPVDPSGAALDLPIVHVSWTDSAGIASARRVLAEVGRIARLDPSLMAEVSEVSVAASGAGALLLSHRIAEVVVPEGVDPVRLAELRAVLSDVEARLGASALEHSSPRLHLDLRFSDQIVVRYPTSV